MFKLTAEQQDETEESAAKSRIRLRLQGLGSSKK